MQETYWEEFSPVSVAYLRRSCAIFPLYPVLSHVVEFVWEGFMIRNWMAPCLCGKTWKSQIYVSGM